jgi:hypothetical protein
VTRYDTSPYSDAPSGYGPFGGFKHGYTDDQQTFFWNDKVNYHKKDE